MRGDLLGERFDIRIEGTLQWEGQGPRLVEELETADYAQVTVIAVDTPQDLCLAGAWQRWAGPRCCGEPTAHYTPPTAVTTTFTTGPDGTPTSRCTTNAAATHQLATTSTTLTTTLVTLHRTPHGPTLATPTPPRQSPHPTRPLTREEVLQAITQQARQPPTTPDRPTPPQAPTPQRPPPLDTREPCAPSCHPRLHPVRCGHLHGVRSRQAVTRKMARVTSTGRL
ncbi:hypothetical protein [Actinomyces wuliandei]|uniref:hypothetical protein n=1 Tax=Actinomyces wuliandei TaxID=2057743 RepID=UPI0013E2E943|nr:hypothetical protein [Actinomyces wuliandei]